MATSVSDDAAALRDATARPSWPSIKSVSAVQRRRVRRLVGPSGCGKTTCLRMAARPDSDQPARVTVGGKPVTAPGPDRAVVFQQFALFPWKTVHDNIEFGLRCWGVPQATSGAQRIAATSS